MELISEDNVAQEKQRSAKFNEDELNILNNLIKRYKHILLNKQTVKVTPKQREDAWRAITNEFNSDPACSFASKSHQLKNKWDYMKRKAKKAVNSPPLAHRELPAPSPATYRPYYEEVLAARREPPAALQPEPKKDKKWSIGKLFRRKKKDESSSSTESDEGVSSRSLSKKKSKKKKRTPAVNNFDHIVIRESRRAQSLAKPSVNDLNDDGVLSDPSAGFINYREKVKEMYDPKNVLKNEKYAKSSLETPSRKSRKKNRLKARVEALRNSIIGNSSSDEESLRSSNSSSMLRFRSDESLMRSRDGSLSKRSRSARNDRYIKRLSRDDENQLNREAELLQQGYTKAEVEMLTRTPTSQSSGYGTCKRESANKPKSEQTYINELTRRPLKSESVSSFPSTQSYPSSINFNAKVNNDHINYSIPYPARNTNREQTYANKHREGSVGENENVMCVKFPLGNVTNVNREEKAPPVPPPRDMHRKVTTPLSMYHQNLISTEKYANQNNAIHGVPNNDFARVMRRSQERSTNCSVNNLRRPISTSEDHIAMQNNEYFVNIESKADQPRRPASVSVEPNHYGLYINTPPWKKTADLNKVIKPEAVPLRQDYLYFADQSPRSRRPISVKTSQNGIDSKYLSDSQTSLSVSENMYRKPRNASEFWKKLDDAEKNRRQIYPFANARSKSECPTNIQSYVPVNQADQYRHRTDSTNDIDIQNKNKNNRSVDTTDSARIWKATTEYKRALTVEPEVSPTIPSKTHTRHKSDTLVSNSNHILSDEDRTSERRKSTNLDDALNELEAIYNSLGLGDEDLLDRAERRELMTPKLNDRFNDWNGNDDGSVQLRSQPTTPLRSRRSDQPDKLQDDMAFRRMNSLPKEKQSHNDTQTQISYMLASPVYVPYASDDDKSSVRNEPDVVHDDVMYRNIKHSNNKLKTIDPQPPFGIPIGPVSQAPQSDYLHAMPENKSRPRFIPRRSPDIVSDDLAYRSLRKDNRHSNSFHMDDSNPFVNNNHTYNEYPKYSEPLTNVKKKRAVRSLSANIFTMIQKEIDDAMTMSNTPTLQKTHSNSEVMRRLRETFENNDNDRERSPRNKVKQRHNTVSLFVNNSHSPTHHFAKDDSCINNDEKYLAKPPSCDKSKTSSPSNRSPQVSKRSSKEEFQQVLSMLAQEAMDTSNKLGVALAEMDKNRNSMDNKTDIQSKISDSRALFLNGLTARNNDEIFPEVKHVKVHCEIINAPPKEGSWNDYDNTLKAKKTEDSLMKISNQLNKVENKLKHSMEKEINIQDESINLSDYVTKVEEKKKAQETLVMAVNDKSVPDINSSNIQNDSIKIQALKFDKKVEPPEETVKRRSLNPFLSADEQCNEINELDAFKELKDGITNLINGISHVNDKLFVPKPSKDETQKLDKIAGISEVNEKLNQVAQQQITDSNQQVPKRASVNLSIYEDDLEIKRDAADSTEYNSSEELATIFNLDNKVKTEVTTKENYNEHEKKVRDELSSPKLVQSMNQQLRRLSVDHSDGSRPSQSNSLPTNVVPWRTKRQHSQSESRAEDNPQPKRSWHDSSTLMVACSYTLMFADMDWLSLLGLLLAIVTIIAMLLI